MSVWAHLQSPSEEAAGQDSLSCPSTCCLTLPSLPQLGIQNSQTVSPWQDL